VIEITVTDEEESVMREMFSRAIAFFNDRGIYAVAVEEMAMMYAHQAIVEIVALRIELRELRSKI
jgi:hypothetical protein